uniref:Glutaredoxin domain-containing protein n=1 Tax=Rhizobium phage LG08 TaxID=3129229 RepID=A0AAU8HY46_9CAUD
MYFSTLLKGSLLKIDIYTIADCVFCAKAKAVLECRRREFTVKDVTENKKEFMDELQAKFGFPDSERTFPKLFIDGELVMGYTELKKKILIGAV